MIMDPCSCHIELRQATGNAITKLRENIPVILFSKLNEILLGHFNFFLLVITKISNLQGRLVPGHRPRPKQRPADRSDRSDRSVWWVGRLCAVRRTGAAGALRRAGTAVRSVGEADSI